MDKLLIKDFLTKEAYFETSLETGQLSVLIPRHGEKIKIDIGVLKNSTMRVVEIEYTYGINKEINAEINKDKILLNVVVYVEKFSEK